MTKINTLENSLIVLGTTYGIAQIENVIGIVILIMQFLLIVLKYIPKFVERVKSIFHTIENADIVGFEDSINDAIEDVDSFIDELEVLKDEQSK